MDAEERLTDWINLPENARTVSLWDTLHDGDLLGVQSDRLARTVTLRFDVPYVREFNRLSEDTRFVLVLEGVRSVRATVSEQWPGEFSVPSGASREEQFTLIAEYQAKWREESQLWPDFERLMAEGAEVSDATVALDDDAVALKLGARAANDRYYEAHISAKSLTFSVGNRLFTLAEFAGLGEAYWEAFSERRLP